MLKSETVDRHEGAACCCNRCWSRQCAVIIIIIGVELLMTNSGNRWEMLLPLFVLICPVSGGALQLVGWLVGCISAGTRICTHRLKKYIPQSRCMKVDM
ncbi:hypothetical protein T4D_7659 [Trichinella pseudospiralis]|uniref:Transmembrane protein n=1 Tax=Trichinella pseudospiralis TaxID=6337 RepID=A0A0V1FAS9_TRIPS|nr:hypothetical protein T4D_7659 [Trichinella pseudospiralis]